MTNPPGINRLLFIAASCFADVAERRSFLEFACGGDRERLKRLELLLEAQNDADQFFEAQPDVIGDHESGNAAGGGDELGARIGAYRLIDRLGSGGAGVVYLAERIGQPQPKVALKIIRLSMDAEDVIARFAVESRALTLMDHKNIARVIDGGTTVSGLPYFVMELVDGEKITDYCDGKRLTLRERLGLFVQVCDAIQHAHQKGVIHRDIKPSNILVREADGTALPMVIDFGIAKAADGPGKVESSNSRRAAFLGTPSYMSPEQAEGGADIDTRSDIYGLGALLCELLTGRPPFEIDLFTGKNFEEIRDIIRDEETGVPSIRLRDKPKDEIARIAEQRSVDPQRLLSQLGGDLDWIVVKAIEKDRRRRYETANALAMDVRRFLSEEAILARPPSRRYLLTKLIRRNRVLFTAIVVALSGLVSGLGASTWLFLRERQARREAEHARAVEVQFRQRAQAAERLTQAAVLVRYGQIEEADALLTDMSAELVPLSLEAADTLLAVAEWNLTESRWKAAAERFSALVPVITSVDLSDTDRMSRTLMPAATAIKEWGEPSQYRQLRELALRRFSDTSHEGVAAQVAKAVMLEPADPKTLDRIRQIESVMRTALSDAPSPTTQLLYSWRTFSMGLLAYREGDLESAQEWIGRSLDCNWEPPQLIISNQIVLAMIHLRHDELEQARPLLAKARKGLEKWNASPFKLGTGADYWFDWVNARILLREAEAMLQSPAR